VTGERAKTVLRAADCFCSKSRSYRQRKSSAWYSQPESRQHNGMRQCLPLNLSQATGQSIWIYLKSFGLGC